ncbi:MAG: hypothetical protein ACKOTZ_00485 [Chloroflexota bacterium]
MSDLADLAATLAALGRTGDRDGAPAAPPVLLAIGWATVDLERSLAALGAAAEAGPEVAEPALGARARVVAAGPVPLVVLEPVTEGRLAAALARRGEGIAALWVAGDPGPAARSGALGRPARLLTHARPWGPYLLVAAAADPV